MTHAAELTPELKKQSVDISKRSYSDCSLSGYIWMDFQITDREDSYLLKANPNPNISYSADYAKFAEHSNITCGFHLKGSLKLVGVMTSWNRIGL